MKKTTTEPQCNNQDMMISQSKIDKDISAAKERELALDICLTSLMFREFEFEDDEIMKSPRDNGLCKDRYLEKNASIVIEEEALRYIGVYIVKKFNSKYQYLGNKMSNNGTNEKTWVEAVNRGKLYAPSDELSFSVNSDERSV